MATTTLTASVVGCGMGGTLSLDALNRSEYFTLIAAADIDADARGRTESRFPGIKSYSSHEEMFDRAPTDVVCVSTWAPSHEDITLAALDLPLKGILVEKPLGHTSSSGRGVISAIKAKGIPMVVPHNLLAQSSTLDLLDKVAAGAIGAVKLMEIQCAKWDIINAGIHWMHYFVNLTGLDPIEYVIAACDSRTRTFRDGFQVETNAVTYVQTRSGTRCVMNTGDDTNINHDEGEGISFRIVGSAGFIALSEAWGSETYSLYDSTGLTVVTPPQIPKRGHQFHLEKLRAMIESQVGSDGYDYSIADSSLMALEICEAAYISNRHGCQIDFPLESFTPPRRVDWDPGTPYSGAGGGRDGRKL